MSAERAGRWLRVSSGGQDEANQEPSIDKWIDDHAYQVPADCTYTVHGKSASKGKHQKYLDRMLADMRAGKISVLVVWQSSRIERRGIYSVFDLAQRVREAGGRIEYTEDTHLNAVNEMSDVNLALNAHMDYQKSQTISKTTRAGHNRSRANKALIGRPPWGYTSEGDRYNRRLITTPEGEKYAPELFTRIADGQKLTEVSAWLSGVTGRSWFPRVITQTIRRTTYRGERRDGKGRIVHTCPALVDGDLWRRANANLDARPSGRRGHPLDLDAGALQSGLVFCGNRECTAGPDSPMYRARDSYRCAGRGAQRRGCGCTVDLTQADELMNKVMSGLRRPVLEPRFHPAEGHQIELDDVDQQLADLPQRGLPRAAEQAERERLWARQDELSALPAKAAWTEFVPVLDAAGEPVTYGSKWASSDQAARRAWLKDAGFSVSLARPDMLADGYDGDDGDGVLSTVDIYESGTAALIFEWAGDGDAGLGRSLH
jgi:DNA invertase Pin-like site-specific DNA recombinase